MRAGRWPIGWLGCAVLFGAAWMPRAAGSPMVHWSLLAAAGVFAAWLAALTWAARAGRRQLAAMSGLRAPHVVQFFCHSSIYAYWAMYVPLVVHQLPLIATQIVFAFLLDMCLSWTRRRPWLVGFGPIPIVFSTNLFLWFKDEWFALQLGLVALAFLSRELIRWRRDGQSIHVFNPSAAGLAVASIALIATKQWDITWGEEIATTLENAPYMFELIFLTGIIVQSLFSVTLMTASAALSMWAIVAIHHPFADGNFMFLHTTIPIAVFLGMTLLFTDPATSPRTKSGKVLFGVGYSVMVCVLYYALPAIGAPAYFDKLLPVPILNLLVPAIDRLGRRIDEWLPTVPLSARSLNYVHVAIWITGFALLRPELVAHPGAQPEHWRQLCEAGKPHGCLNLVEVLRVHCVRTQADSCHELSEYLADETNLDYDEKSASVYRQHACRLGRAASCAAGVATGSPPPDNRTACDGGAGEACAELGNEYALGVLGGAPDPVMAAETWLRACDLGAAEACANAGLVHLQGRGIALDKTRGVSLHQRACDLGLAVACGRLGFLYEKGEGAVADAERARSYYQQACRLGDRGSCRQMH